MTEHTRLYEILDIHVEATEQEIKTAYRKMAIKYHPDKNPGSEDKFKEISLAYEILSDPEKKSIYDKYGEEGLKEGGGMDEDLFNFFGFPFGGRGGRGGPGRAQKRKGKDVGVAYPVTLEELYNGKHSQFKLEKTVLCNTCSGKGSLSPDSSSTKCQACEGSGITVSLRPLGFGMVQQLQERCRTCHGEGEVIKLKDRCTECKGNKVMEQEKILDVYVEKGMKHGTKITFAGEGDQAPDILPGDVILVLQQKEHPTFKRDKDDLYLEKKISLGEALCGFKLVITHLDGRALLVSSNPGEIIRPGDVKCVEGEGMPQLKNPFTKGKLFIQFEVEFPEDGLFTPEVVKSLAAILPRPSDNLGPLPDDIEQVKLETPSATDGEDEHKHAREAYQDEDDEDQPRGGGGVTCHQQ